MKPTEPHAGRKITDDFSASVSRTILRALTLLAIPQITLSIINMQVSGRREYLPLIFAEIFVSIVGLVFILLGERMREQRPVLTIATSGAMGILLVVSFGLSSTGPLWMLFALIQCAIFFGMRGFVTGFLLTGFIVAVIATRRFISGQLSPQPLSILPTLFNLVFIAIATTWPLTRILGKLGLYHDENLRLAETLNSERIDLNRAQKSIEEESALRHAVQESLKEREAKYRGILELSEDLSLVLDKDAIVLFAAGGLAKTLGWRVEEIMNRDIGDFIHPDDLPEADKEFTRLLGMPESGTRGRLRIRTKNGDYILMEARAGNRLADASVHGVIMTMRDITWIHQNEEKIAFLEGYDQLTELPNRARFSSRLTDEIARARGRGQVFAVLVIGVDRFKRINDFYGTDTGDMVLKQAARGLMNTFRQGDLIARLRGDKFLVLLSDMHRAEDIGPLVRKAEGAITHSYEVPDGSIQVSCSMGVALYPNDGLSASSLIKNAETAMYMAKDEGGSSWRMFDQALNNRVIARQKLEDELHHAVEEDWFQAWYQPKITAAGGISGMEALIRWAQPDGTMRSPTEFIPTAERTGSIVPIGHTMLTKACLQILEWSQLGLGDVPISVNLSPKQFKDEGLIMAIERIVSFHGVAPHLIELELTESSILADESDGIRKLQDLRDMGFKLSIDDFGTGYSSFAKLKDYPVDTVKIDKSFIDPLPGDRRAGIVTRAIIELAHSLECSVVAEGVETREQLNFLHKAGCDSFQGYYFAAPLESARATRFIREDVPLLSRRILD